MVHSLCILIIHELKHTVHTYILLPVFSHDGPKYPGRQTHSFSFGQVALTGPKERKHNIEACNQVSLSMYSLLIEACVGIAVHISGIKLNA